MSRFDNLFYSRSCDSTDSLNFNLNVHSDTDIGNYVIAEAPAAAGIGIVCGLVCFAFPLFLVVTIDVVSLLKYAMSSVPGGSLHDRTMSHMTQRSSRSLIKRLKRTNYSASRS